MKQTGRILEMKDFISQRYQNKMPSNALYFQFMRLQLLKLANYFKAIEETEDLDVDAHKEFLQDFLQYLNYFSDSYWTIKEYVKEIEQ